MLHRLNAQLSLLFSVGWKLILVVIVLIAVSLTVYNCGDNPFPKQTFEYKLPSERKAGYEVVIYNTGNRIFTDEYSLDGTTYTLNGYWELVKNKYKYRDAALILDEKDFGRILIRYR